MENKTNIAEILKDCPSGMELDCTMFENVTFARVDMSKKKQFPIEIVIRGKQSKYLTKEGCFHDVTLLPDAKCVIFPKGKTTWEGFQRPFMDGDILISGLEGCEGNSFIFKQINGFGNAECHCAINCFGELIFNSDDWTPIKGCRFATKEEKAKLFQAIKDNGYKWNEERKTLEKLIEPKFKVGDVIKTILNLYKYTVIGITNTHYTVEEVDDKFQYTVPISEDKNWILVPNKFDITTLIPFESKVLVRDNMFEKWKPSYWGFYDKDNYYYPYKVIGGKHGHCIPYEGNEHLLGTTNDCDDFYKTWEK